MEFKNVDFVNSSRADALVLKNVSTSIPAGKDTAAVGPLGGGKPTVVALIIPHYDPTETAE